MPTVIPQDLIPYIINELVSDKATLHSCTLVSWSFREHCQKHLFSSIVISLSPARAARNEQLNNILIQNQSIGSFVRKLSIRLWGVSSKETLSGTLRMLPRVHELDMGSRSSMQVHWSSLAAELRLDLLRLLRLSTLEHIYLHGIQGFPVSWFSSCAQLKTLRLFFARPLLPGVHDLKTTSSIESSPVQRGYLQSLHVWDSTTHDDLLQALVHSSSVLGLSRLSAYKSGVLSQSSDILGCQKVIELSNESLKVLHINIHRGGLVEQTAMNLGGLQNLYYLHINITAKTGPALGWIARTFETLRPVNELSEIFVNLYTGITETSDLEDEAWGAIDATLAKEGNNPHLRHIHISLRSDAEVVGTADYHKAFTRGMPHLISKRCLSIYNNGNLIFPIDVK